MLITVGLGGKGGKSAGRWRYLADMGRGEGFFGGLGSSLGFSGCLLQKNEPHHEKTIFLHMRKQRRRSASQ